METIKDNPNYIYCNVNSLIIIIIIKVGMIPFRSKLRDNL